VEWTRHADSDESDLPAGLGAPARRALLAAGYHLIAQLDGVRESDIGQLHGIGRQALNLLRRALDDKGMSFAP